MSGEFRDVYRTELTPASFLTRSAYVFPQKPAVVHGTRRYSYAQLGERVHRLASALRGAGMKKHDRVAFLCPNTPAMLEAHFGVPAAGGILVAVNTPLGSDENGFILKHLGPRVLFMDHELYGLGKPADVAGGHVCLRKVESARIWELIDKEGVTHYSGAPTVHIGVVNDPKAHRLRYPVTVCVAGAPPSPTLLGKLGELGFRPVHIYGLTETYGPHTVCAWHAEWDARPLEEQARLAARQGQGYALFDLVRVVDADMHDVPKDGVTLGEVIMRGNNVMTGYFEQRDATAEAFRGGWFHSGDLAVWHPDGYIELRDRKKDIIISGGENISTIEVEQTVAKHPAVLECAVVAIPDAKWGERPKAFVTLKPGTTATEPDIIELCRQHIAHVKCPAAVEFRDLPKNSTGKVQKFVLREKEWRGKEKRVN